MPKSENAMSTAGALLAERRKYEEWLAALEARRGSTPDHVFARVRGDYERRLADVVTELATKADALDARVTELAARAEELRAEAQGVTDERCEAELRAHVGELDPAAWEEAATAADERLERLRAEESAVRDELASIRELLDAARAPTPAPGMAAVEAVEPAPAVDAGVGEPGSPDLPLAVEPTAAAVADVEADLAAAAAPGEPDLPPSSLGDFGDVLTEAADVPAPPAHAADAAGGDAPLASEPAAPRSEEGFDELAFLRNVTGVTPGKPLGLDIPVPRPSGERPLDDSLGLILPDDTPAFTPPRRPSTETPMAANVTGNSPIVIKGEQKQGKTLKCTDCGSLNYPTEWYCERCGAELSAL